MAAQQRLGADTVGTRKFYVLVVLRVFFAGLVVAAITAQARSLQRGGQLNPYNFFSFFTIQSNIIAAGVLLLGAAMGRHRHPWLDVARGAATLYMVVTGVVYALLLSNIEVQTTVPWVNQVLHRVFPVAMVLDWLWDRPAHISFRTALWWVVYPLTYAAYTLVRGPIVLWYPYPFLDPAQHGYGQVALTCVGIGLAVTGVAWLLARATPAVTRRHKTAA